MDPNLRHPHNVWLEMGAMWGAVGLLWLSGALAIVSATLMRLRRARGKSSHEAHHQGRQSTWPIVAGMTAGLAAGFAHGQVDAFGALADLAGWNWSALALVASYAAAWSGPNDYGYGQGDKVAD